MKRNIPNTPELLATQLQLTACDCRKDIIHNTLAGVTQIRMRFPYESGSS